MKRHQLTCEVCGHQGNYQSAELAAFHFPRHSCELVIERRNRAERRLARLAAHGEDRPCSHKTHHQHGTYIRYSLDKCRCHPCKLANRTVEQNRRRQALYGRARLVPADTARAHVQALMAQGMGLKRIAEVAGMHSSLLGTLIYGRGGSVPSERRPPTKQISRQNEVRILAVELDLADGAKVDPTGTLRRLRALVAIGWSQRKLAGELSMNPSNFGQLLHGRGAVVKSTRRAVSELYDRLWDRPPIAGAWHDKSAANRSTAYARAHGWVPPLAWDDDAIDDPSARPATDLEDHRANATRVHAEDVEWLLDEGLTIGGIADRLRVRKGTIQTSLIRQERRDLWERLMAAEERRRTAPRRVA